MTKFSWAKGFGFGLLIWLIMFALASAIIAFGAAIGTGWGIMLAAASGVAALLFAMSAKAENMYQAMGYGALWAAIGILLDLIISWQFAPELFSTWTYYLGYALVLLAPGVQMGLSGQSPTSMRGTT